MKFEQSLSAKAGLVAVCHGTTEVGALPLALPLFVVVVTLGELQAGTDSLFIQVRRQFKETNLKIRHYNGKFKNRVKGEIWRRWRGLVRTCAVERGMGTFRIDR